MSDEDNRIELSTAELTVKALHERLAECPPGAHVHLKSSKRLHGLGAGLEHNLSLAISGDVGDFVFLMSDQVDIDVKGHAGVGCGHSFVSGSVLIRGTAGDYLGAYATGGFIAVHGAAGKRCGLGLAGADVFVRSGVGDEAGCYMSSGTLVLGNGAGENIGYGMTGGLIYIRGEVKSVAEHARQVRMKDAESLRLGLFLARAGIKAGGADFRVYRARQELKV